jgi:hypothetical protein
MSNELNRVYEALQKADQAGNAEDARQLAAYARQLESQQTKEAAPEGKEKPVEAKLNDIMYPAAGAVAGTSLGTASGAGRMLYGGAKAAARMADPEAMAAAKLQAEKNAVETWARTQNRVPGMVAEKPGLYFGQPRYDLEAAKAKEEMAKMISDPEYHAKVVAEQKPSVSAYEKRVAAANPSTMQKVGRALSKAPVDFIAGPLAGLGAGFQASDAVNRYNEGDKLGSVISGIGAAGSGLAMIPHPITRIGGTAVGLGAEGLNAYIDFLRKNNPFDRLIQQSQQQQQPQAQPQQPQQPPRQMANGGHVKHFAIGGSTSYAPPMPMGFESASAMESPVGMMDQQIQADVSPFAMEDSNAFIQPKSAMVDSMPTQLMSAYQNDFMPLQLTGGMAQPQMMESMAQQQTPPTVDRMPFGMTQRPVDKTPMNPFNPGFAARRPVMPAQPRPNMRPQAPQPFAPAPMGGLNSFRSPITQRRIAAGLSQLPRKPMFRRFDEGGLV